METSEGEHAYCPLAMASLLLSSKWDLIIISNLMSGPKHFQELKTMISMGIEGTITPASLSRVLKRLQEEGLIERQVKVKDLSPIEIQYRLTKMGEDLRPVLDELRKWGEKYQYKIIQKSN
ncbi:MAG: transcriptional regulator [Methanobacteriota archaeon]|nr:MAG: transcriptional regulator [Euryarchaeota archaeon]